MAWFGIEFKYSKILIFKAIFLCRKSGESLQKKIHLRIQKWEMIFYQYQILITLIFNELYLLKMRPNFDVRYQIKPNWPFSKTFGLAYSQLNSATLSCSSEVTLIHKHVYRINLPLTLNTSLILVFQNISIISPALLFS